MNRKEKKDNGIFGNPDGQLNGILTAGNSSMTDVLLWALLILPAWIGKNGAGVCMVNIGMFAGTTFAWLFLVRRLRTYRDVSKKEMFHIWDYIYARYQSVPLMECFLTVWLVLTTLLACAVIKMGSRIFGHLLKVEDQTAATGMLVFLLVMQCLMRSKTRALVRTIFYSTVCLLFLGLIVLVFLSYTPRGLLDIYGSIHLTGGTSSYLNILYIDGGQIGGTDLISMLGVGVGCLGLPFIFEGAFGARDVRELDRGRVLSILYSGGIIVAASVWSLLNIACIYPVKIQTGDRTDELLELFMQALIQKNGWPDGVRYVVLWIYGLTLLFLAEQFTEGMFAVARGMVRADRNVWPEKKRMVCFFVSLAVVMFVLAGWVFCFGGSEQTLIWTAWEYAETAAAPCIFVIAGKIASKASAWAGLLAGLGCCKIWRYAPLIDGKTLATATNLQAGTAAFIFGLSVSVIVAMFTYRNNEAERKLFDRMKLEQR